MSVYEILGLILIGIVVIAVLIAALEKGPCQPKDFYWGKKK